jgi:hypothetical protein
MNKLKRIRRILIFFMIALVISGATAMPIETELRLLLDIIPVETPLSLFITKVHKAVIDIQANAPFLLYGYDWLAFAHFVLAILFIGPYKDPVKNKWVIEFGLIACAFIIPFAFIVGYVRSIPVYWRLVDCSFGILGAIPLFYVLKMIHKIEKSSWK